MDQEENSDCRVLLFDGPARRGGGIPRREPPFDYFRATRIHEGSGGNHVYLDPFGRYALYVTLVGHADDSELELYKRMSWMDAFDEGRPAHYANWRDLLAPAGMPSPEESTAE